MTSDTADIKERILSRISEDDPDQDILAWILSNKGWSRAFREILKRVEFAEAAEIVFSYALVYGLAYHNTKGVPNITSESMAKSKGRYEKLTQDCQQMLESVGNHPITQKLQEVIAFCEDQLSNMEDPGPEVYWPFVITQEDQS